MVPEGKKFQSAGILGKLFPVGAVVLQQGERFFPLCFLRLFLGVCVVSEACAATSCNYLYSKE
mgnify:CR=1